MNQIKSKPQTFYQRIGKRVVDAVLALGLLLVLAPVMLGVWALVRRKLGSPAFFKQVRPGKEATLFRMVKFRSMTEGRNLQGELLPDKERLPAFGQFLRSTSLDELPELWNVLKGEMSLVGPRPLLERYLDRYTEQQARRHEVLPGVTGWAQVNGRNAISWEEKFEYDLWYVENQSFGLDIKILFLTAWKVLRRDSVTAEGEATAPEFMGTFTEKRAA